MAIDRELQEYLARTGRSRALYEEALGVMPGGNSRTTTFFDPYPFYLVRGEGAHVWDADGVDRVDFNGNYTSLILGHAHPDVVKAVHEAATQGLSFPGPTEHEIRLAELLTRRLPSLEQVRFTNSGTEATMNAVRAARAFTGRPKVAKFEGAYHGTHDAVLVSVAPDLGSLQGGHQDVPEPVGAGLRAVGDPLDGPPGGGEPLLEVIGHPVDALDQVGPAVDAHQGAEVLEVPAVQLPGPSEDRAEIRSPSGPGGHPAAAPPAPSRALTRAPLPSVTVTRSRLPRLPRGRRRRPPGSPRES